VAYFMLLSRYLLLGKWNVTKFMNLNISDTGATIILVFPQMLVVLLNRRE
jgi:hypothetical protein